MKLLFDFFPILLFFIAFKLFGIYTATAVAIAASFLQVGGYWLRHRRFETMHLLTLGIIVLFGGATLLLHDETFIKWKPSVVQWLFGLAFLGSQFLGEKPMIERMLSGTVTLPGSVWRRLNASWTVFFFATGFANIYVAYTYDTNTWVNFKLFGMFGLTVAFVIGQAFYLARHMEPEEEAPLSPPEEENG